MNTMFETESDIYTEPDIDIQKPTLEEYLRQFDTDEKRRFFPDFILSISHPEKDYLKGYLYPHGINGQTVNFVIQGNSIVIGEPYKISTQTSQIEDV